METISQDFDQSFCIVHDEDDEILLKKPDQFYVYDDNPDPDVVEWEDKHWHLPVYSKDTITFKMERKGFTLQKTYNSKGGFSMKDMYDCLADWVKISYHLDHSWAFGGMNHNDDDTFEPCFNT